MNRGNLLAATAVASVVRSARAEESSGQLLRKTPLQGRAEVWMKQVNPSFAMAYFFGSLDEKLDKRPPMRGDPFGTKEEMAAPLRSAGHAMPSASSPAVT